VWGLVQFVAAFAMAGQLDVGGTVTIETRGGEAPLTPGQEPEAAWAGILTPALDLRYHAPAVELRAGYDLRMYLRESGSAPNAAPLYLHRWVLRADTRPNARLRTTSSATVLEGAADYGYLPYIVGTNQATLVIVPRIFSAAVEERLQVNASETVTLELLLSASHHRPLGNASTLPPVQAAATNGSTTPVAYPLPRFTSASAMPAVDIRLSRTEVLRLSSILELQYISSLISLDAANTLESQSLESFTVVPTTGLLSVLARNSTLDLRVGVALNHLASSRIEANSVSPVGGVIFDQRLVSLRESVLKTTLGAMIDFYVDPILATASPRGVATASLSLALPDGWVMALEGNFGSSLSGHPRTNGVDVIYPDEVAASASMPVRHRVSDYLTMEFGGRWSDRAPYFDAPNFAFHQRQLWIYLLLTGTTRAARSVAP
jgi:hypothetical protein